MKIRIILAFLACSSALCAQSVGGGIQGASSSGGGPPTGAAGGDLSGTYPNPTIASAISRGGTPVTLTFGAATSTSNLFTVQDTASNTGTGYVLTAGTASGSAANPFQILCGNVQCASMAGATRLLTIGGSLGFITMGQFPAAGGTYGAVYFNQPSPDAGNFAFLGSAADSYFNAPFGVLHFKIANSVEPLTLTASAATISVPMGVPTLGLTTTVAATCAAGIRGQFQYTAGGAGVKDIVQVCAKDAADSYAWRPVY